MSHEVLRVRIGDREAAVALEAVDEIVRMVELSPVPGGGTVVRGAMNLRGEIVVVLDVATLLGQAPVAEQPSGYIVLLRCTAGRFGFLADDALAVTEVAEGRRREIGARTEGPVRAIAHVDGRLIPILDPEGIVAESR